MQFTAQQIGTLLEGRIEGNPEVTVGNLPKLRKVKRRSFFFVKSKI
jgi:UDP-3-O-[3-hydroxymyristoyl] glucosamine N-acyltransferase